MKARCVYAELSVSGYRSGWLGGGVVGVGLGELEGLLNKNDFKIRHE